LCSGLAHLHQAGFCHRDIKPDNLMLDESDNLVIIDFGTCVKTGSPPVGGTPLYSPKDEMFVTEASDMFAVGCVLYELLSGQQLYANPSGYWRWDKTCPKMKSFPQTKGKENVLFDPKVPKTLQDLIRTMLHPSGDSRPSTSGALAVLRTLLAEQK